MLLESLDARHEPGLQPPTQRSRKLRVLSIDGGGMRGIIPARMIAYLEESLRRKSNNPNAVIADYFDLVAGTSVGGLIAMILFATSDGKTPLYSGQEVWKLIAEIGREIFNIPYPQKFFAIIRGIMAPRYSTRYLESILQKHLTTEDGRELTLADMLKTAVIPCYDLTRAGAYYFYNNLEVSSNFKLRDVCRATTAAPTFFKPAMVQSLDGNDEFTAADGALVMNNPTMAAITHAIHDKKKFPDVQGVQDMLILSLGTGQFDQTYAYDEVRNWGALQWAKPVAKAIMDGISDMVDHTVSMAFTKNRQDYVRIQVSGIPDEVGMDDPSPENVRRLISIADELLDKKSLEHLVFGGRKQLDKTNREQLDWFSEQLVLHHG